MYIHIYMYIYIHICIKTTEFKLGVLHFMSCKSVWYRSVLQLLQYVCVLQRVAV